jgi:hypothetical protein
MAIGAGGSVLLGRDPGYYVINWLPVYNVAAGMATVLVTAVLIWRGSKYALPAALVTFGAHALVMITLQAAYRDVVAADSIVAMTVRMVAWLVILGLMLAQGRRDRRLAPAEARRKPLLQ